MKSAVAKSDRLFSGMKPVEIAVAVALGAAAIGVAVYIGKGHQSGNAPLIQDERIAFKTLAVIPGAVSAEDIKVVDEPGKLVHSDYVNLLMKATEQCKKLGDKPSGEVKYECGQAQLRYNALSNSPR